MRKHMKKNIKTFKHIQNQKTPLHPKSEVVLLKSCPWAKMGLGRSFKLDRSRYVVKFGNLDAAKLHTLGPCEVSTITFPDVFLAEINLPLQKISMLYVPVFSLASALREKCKILVGSYI